MKINGKELTVKPLGAVQAIRLLTQGLRAQYMEDAKTLASELEGRDKAVFMSEMHRGLRSLDHEDAQIWARSAEGVIAMVRKACGISEQEAIEISEQASEEELDALMKEINPDAEPEDEKVVAFQQAVDAVLSARFTGDPEAMAKAVPLCSDALRSISLLTEAPSEKK